MKTKAQIKSQVFTENNSVLADGFNSIEITNTGDVNFTVLENIQLEPGDRFTVENDKEIIINQNINIRFDAAGVGVKKALIIKKYLE